MPRPHKVGLDYFPLYVTLPELEYIKGLYGMIGVQVIISLWQKIYQKNGYYIEYDNMSSVIFSNEFGEQLERCFPSKNKQRWEIYDEIVHRAFEDGVFDKAMFDEYGILTSQRIQELYVFVKKKRAEELIDERYLLLSAPKN